MNRRIASQADTRRKFKYALFALIGLILSPLTMAYASPSPADSTYFCAFDDREQWRRDHPRPAAKRLANLNVGEPRTVRMIYFSPNDQPYRQEVVDEMKAVILRVQTFYGEQMEAHGYGNLTFRFETDAQGEPVVHRVDGKHPSSYYTEEPLDEISEVFDLHRNVYFIIAENDQGWIGVGSRLGKNGGYAVLDESYAATGFEFFTAVTAHELGHAFGLWHDFRDDRYIMSYGWPQDRLSASAAEFLSVHPYFNPTIPIREGPPPSVELISPTRYPAGSQSVFIQLKVSDSTGIHQVCLQTIAFTGLSYEVTACRSLSGKTDAVVEFEYDGVIPSSSWDRYGPLTSLSNPTRIQIMAVDTDGNARGTTDNDEQGWTYSLAEVSPYEIATLEAYSRSVHSLAFSPEGALLAFLQGTTVRLWDVATQKQVATLDHGQAVAFSRDGTLAIGAQNYTTLWNVANGKKKKIATLDGGVFTALTFSANGALLAAATESTVRLWDVATRKEVAALDMVWVTSLAFSPDGTTLAFVSGHPDPTIRLWDVATQKQVATLDHGRLPWPTSVVFSPDGTTLASGHTAWHRTVALWDVQTREQVAVLERKGSGEVTSLAFSPDGTTLASAGGFANNTVRLWDVQTRREIEAFGHTDPFYSVAFSPDGLLAAGSEEVIILYDVSEWAGEGTITTVEQAMPHTLTIVSGDGQEGTVGEPLAKPFVVSVLDQEGAAFAGAVVSFSVSAGGGTLSSATATTDANGRARTTLTLGPEPGTNTVTATVAGLEPVTFTATAIEQTPHSLAKVSGDGQQGPANTRLGPLVVSVLDQDGSPIAGVRVVFSTSGGGLLSPTSATDPCAVGSSASSIASYTDANGQASVRLTLGSLSGTNTAQATVEGLDPVTFTATTSGQASPHRLTKVCGDSQEGMVDEQLTEPFVVSVSNEDGAAIAGMVVSFAVTAGGGTLSSATAHTDANGRAATSLTLGSEAGTNTVAATVEGLAAVTFTATGQEDPLVSLFDLFGSGKRTALPDRTQLLQNAPNPFNSQTVLSYFLLEPSLTRLEVFSLTGQRIAVLHQGPQQAGYHRLHWDGRDAAGHSVASGAYLYRLVTDDAVLTRKLILLR